MACSTGSTKILPSPILPVLAVAARASTTCGDRRVGHDQLELDLRHEVHDVLGAAVDLGMTGLPPVALDLGDHQALHADGGQRLADLLELEWLDHGYDQFHAVPRPRFHATRSASSGDMQVSCQLAGHDRQLLDMTGIVRRGRLSTACCYAQIWAVAAERLIDAAVLGRTRFGDPAPVGLRKRLALRRRFRVASPAKRTSRRTGHGPDRQETNDGPGRGRASRSAWLRARSCARAAACSGGSASARAVRRRAGARRRRPLYYASQLPDLDALLDAREGGSVTLLDASGQTFAWRGQQLGVTRAEEVSPHLLNAIIATEDRRFYWHFGVDLQGTPRALARQPARRRDGAGRLVDHPAGGEAGLLRQHPHARAQDQGDPGGAGAGDGSSPRTRSCRSTSTAPTSAPAPPASRRRPSATSASRRPR